MSNRRTILENVGIDQCPTAHAGLWLDKYLGNVGDGAKRLLVAEVASRMPPHQEYLSYYNCWKAALGALRHQTEDFNIRSRKYQVRGRMAVGLGDKGVLETAITLHHTYGVPIIPGSALKGLAAAFAHQRLAGQGWEKPKPALKSEERANYFYTQLFGDTDQAGYVTFFDAWYVPGSGHDGRPLHPDVLTVHHQEYYQGGKSPADWDSPIPVPFLSATGSYLVALAGPKVLVESAFLILGWALDQMGIGAKTSSGYGRMTFVAEADLEPETITTPATPQEQQAAQPRQQRGQRQTSEQQATGQARMAGVIKALPRDLNYGYIKLDDDQGRGDARFFLDRVTSGTPQIGRRVTCRLRLVNGRWRAEEVHVEE